MTTDELLKAGRLDEAIALATKRVKDAPRNAHERITLFELLAADGQYERAVKHLAVVADQFEEMRDAAASYTAVLVAEQARASLFTTGTGNLQAITPFPVDPEPHLGALRQVLGGDASGAHGVIETAESARPALAGTVDGEPFDDLRDGDDVLAPWLEVIARGQYGWIPLGRILTLTFDPARYLRDVLWRSAEIVLRDGASFRGFVPTRYAGSETSTDPSLKLAQATDWRDTDGLVQGVGQRAFVVGDSLRPMLEVSTLTFQGDTGASA
jgi:type VI secretion system protein ImpE